MATHFDDEEELENLKRWWKDNWKALVAGLVIGFGAIGGWQGYKEYKEKQSLAASRMFDDLKKALTDSKPDEAATIADKLQSDHANTPYAAAAALRLAQVAVTGRNLDQAETRLDWVVAHGEPALRDLAKLRKARVLWQQQKPDDALKLLEGDAGEYASLYDELRGDIAYSKGDRDKARKAYESALKSAPEQAANRSLLQQKIDDLAVDAAPAEPVKS